MSSFIYCSGGMRTPSETVWLPWSISRGKNLFFMTRHDYYSFEQSRFVSFFSCAYFSAEAEIIGLMICWSAT